MSISLSLVRKEFLDYFKAQGHTEVASSSLVPENDPTLLFTNAGMVQFKDVFTGKRTLPFKRATTSQKCVRAGGKHNDLENVGYTARHHTFFEMLGNFSFGDYFKDEVIPFAWNFITGSLGLDPARLLVTVHASDEEAAKIWKSVTGFSDSKIIRIPTNDNFWSMGDTGPCGPCSEIFYDHGSDIPGGVPGSENEDGDRFVEIWNLVFMQFETLADGKRINLPKPSIDTGIGLERLTAVLQGVHNNFHIDLFQKIIKDIQDITNIRYEGNEVHNNVIADHIRAITFMISDGIIPSNEGRGYVLRRIIRRALRHGHALNMHEPFLYKLVDSVTNVMGDHYTEIKDNALKISKILKGEEVGFMKTIDNGMALLMKEVSKLGAKTEFPAETAYKLYDTFGFPFDLTRDILRSLNKVVNIEEFEKCILIQKERSKGAWIGTGDNFTDKVWFDISEKLKQSNIQSKHIYQFLTRDNNTESKILFLVKEGLIVNSALMGDNVDVVIDNTPFYPKGGGAVGDTGTFTCCDGQATVLDTYKIANIIVHKCYVENGVLKAGDIASLHVDYDRRLSISRNHTATHLLQSALRKLFGESIFQHGSLVMPEKLRFDFHCDGNINKSDASKIEDILQGWIDDCLNVTTSIVPKDEAVKSGAMALFGEKYPDMVRVVTIGNKVSVELCSGEHVTNTAFIGTFKITSITSVGSNTFRIEAVTGERVKKVLLSKIAEQSESIEKYTRGVKCLQKENAELKSKLFMFETKIENKVVNNIELQYLLLNCADPKNILSLIDKSKLLDKQMCLLIGNKTKNEMIVLYILVSNLLQKNMSVNKFAQFLGEKLGMKIKSSNRNDLIQLGGIPANKFTDIVSWAEEFLLH